MNPLQDAIQQTRREFFTSTANGVGLLATASLLNKDKAFGAAAAAPAAVSPLAAKASHFSPKAKNCIFIFMEGAPSQLYIFDPKPKLN